jgi:hypothetical protein
MHQEYLHDLVLVCAMPQEGCEYANLKLVPHLFLDGNFEGLERYLIGI